MNYPHLHVKTVYSPMQGLVKLETLAKREVACVTDTTLWAAARLAKMRKKGQTIYGLEIVPEGYAGHVVLLAEDMDGWRTLCLVGRDGLKMGQALTGVHLLTGGADGILVKGKGGEWQGGLLGKLRAMVPEGKLWVELAPTQGERWVELWNLANEHDLPVVATGDVAYAERGSRQAWHVMRAVGERRRLQRGGAWEAQEGPLEGEGVAEQGEGVEGRCWGHLASTAEMSQFFARCPAALRNAADLAARCQVKLRLGVVALPDYVADDGRKLDAAGQIEELRRQAEEGLRGRLKERLLVRGGMGGDEGDASDYWSRLSYELDVIAGTGFAGYFLIYADFVRWGKRNGVPFGPGRGSAAGSMVVWALGITDCDPIVHGLLFERFLNPERVSSGGGLPDIDIDICKRRRSDVVEYLRSRYGRDSVGRIINFKVLVGKTALKDVGRAFGIGYHRLNTLTAGVPNTVNGKTPKLAWMVTEVQALREAVATDPEIARVVKVALELEGCIRESGVHASGIVVSRGPLADWVPTIYAKGGELCSAWDMREAEDAGLVKLDLLGLSTVTMIDLAERMAGVKVDQSLSDADTFRLMARGDTHGVFQMGKGGFRRMLRELKPDRFGDVVAAGALYRPGPIQGGMVKAYCRRKHGQEKVEHFHPLLEPVTGSTYGTLCVSRGSRVLTARGWVPIEQVTRHDLVMTRSGDWHKVMATHNNGVKPCVRVRLTNGEELRLTPDHRLMTARGWVSAGELQKTDLVQQVWGSDEIIPNGDDKDWIVGLLLADGDLCSSTPTVCCSSQEFAESVKRIADTAWGLNSAIYHHTRAWYVTLSTGGVGNSAPNPLTRHLRATGLLNRDFSTKVFPEQVSLAMAAGFFEGDGSTINSRLRVKNEALARRFWEILQAQRIDSSLFLDVADVWTVAVQGLLPLRIKVQRDLHGGYVPTPDLSFIKRSDARRAIQRKTFIGRASLSRIEQDYNRVGLVPTQPWGKVVAVVPCGDLPTHDLTVDVDHSFVVGGSIAHNCYQEQNMSTARVLAGYSLGEADILRRAMGKKKPEEMKAQRVKFVDGCLRLGTCDSKRASEIFDLIDHFSGYGFNVSHSTAYGMLSYYTGWLKTHHPIAFYAALLSILTEEADSYVKIADTIYDIYEHNIRVLPPDVNLSRADFTPENGAVRYGLRGLRGLGKTAVLAIVAAQPFTSLADLFTRVKLGKRDLGSLVGSGALDSLLASEGRTRAQALRHLPDLLAWCKNAHSCTHASAKKKAKATNSNLRINDMTIAIKSEDTLNTLIHWIVERERVRILKESGCKPPWTKDPIISMWRFCNVNRCDDAETRWIFKNIIKAHSDSPVLWFNLALARFINWSPTLNELGFYAEWDEVGFIHVMKQLEDKGVKAWTGAYMIPAGPPGVPKAAFLAKNVFTPLWDLRNQRPQRGSTCSNWDVFLRMVPCMGDFLRNQIITDMKYTPDLAGASDWDSFVLAGPGTQRGLSRLTGNPLTKKWKQPEALAALTSLRQIVLTQLSIPELSDVKHLIDAMRDLNNLSNCLCELDKYCRVKLGEGKPRSKYSPKSSQLDLF